MPGIDAITPPPRNSSHKMSDTVILCAIRLAVALNYKRSSRPDEGYPQQTVWHTILFDPDEQIGAAEYTYDGTHRYHGTVLIRLRNGKISHWREYQHIDPREWEEFVAETAL